MGFLDDLIYGIRDVFDGSNVQYARRSAIKFVGATVVDDSVNARTTVTFSGTTPTGTGLVHVVGGVLSGAASLLVDADVSGSAAIAYAKLNLAGGIVNADVNASAAIAGTKINPAFGSQAITTSGAITTSAGDITATAGSLIGLRAILGGGTPATVGTIRLPYNGASAVTVLGVKDSGAVDRAFITYGSGDVWTLGNSSQSLTCQGGTASIALTTASGVQISAPSLSNAMVITSTQLTLATPITQSSNDTKGTEQNRLPVHVQTTDATVTTLDSFTIPSNCTVIWSAAVAAEKSDNTQGAGYLLTAVFRNNGGTVAQISTTQQGGVFEDDATWDATMDFSGTTARIRVTGKAATTIQWSSISTYLQVIP